MPEQQNPEHQLEYLKELRKKYEEALSNAQKTGDYSEATKLKEELNERLTTLESLFPKTESKAEEIETEVFDELAFEKKTVDTINRFLKDGDIVCEAALSYLTSIDNVEAMKVRDYAYNKMVVMNDDNAKADLFMLRSYAGVDNEQAWRCRATQSNNPEVLRSVAGLDSDRAWKIRDEFKGNAPVMMLNSLMGLDSESAWAVRDSILRNNGDNSVIKSAVLKSLTGLDSDRAWKVRDDVNIHDGTTPVLQGLALSLIGLDSDRAWKVRELFESPPFAVKLTGREGNLISQSLAKSCAGVDSPKAWEFRNRLEGERNIEIFYSLAGLNTERAWDLRMRIFDNRYSSKNVVNIDDLFVESLNGNFITAIGWRTARKYQKKQS